MTCKFIKRNKMISMKKIVFLFFLALLVNQTSQAQKVYAWMDAGLKGGYGLTGLLNSNLFDDKDYEHHLNGGYSIGGKVGLFFGLYNGITIDALYSGFNQKFDYLKSNTRYDHKISWNNIDLALLYRMQKDGVYVELGPQYSLVQKVKNNDPNDPNTDVTDYYNKNYLSGVFGIGGYLFNYETFTTMIGLRMGYGFGDMINADGKAAKYPTPNQVAQYSSKSTNAAFVQIMMEANFALGFYGKSSCSKRATIFSF